MIGSGASWLTLFMVIVTFVIVVMRYVFDAGLIWLQESVIWMHAVVFMLGAAYTLEQEEHVRVDVFYRTMSVQAARMGRPAGCHSVSLAFEFLPGLEVVRFRAGCLGDG